MFAGTFSRAAIPGFIAFLALGSAALFGSVPASAATGTNPIPFQQFKTVSCANALCQTDFAPPPSGKREVITSESCEFTVHQGTKIIEAEIDLYSGQSGGSYANLSDYLVPVLKSSVPVIGDTYAANQQTLVYVPPGFHLHGRLSINASNGERLSCKLTGTIETP